MKDTILACKPPLSKDFEGDCDTCGRENTQVASYANSRPFSGPESPDYLCHVCRNMSGDTVGRVQRAQDIWITYDLMTTFIANVLAKVFNKSRPL